MLRRLALQVLFCVSGATAGILTDNLGTAKRVTLETPAIEDKPVWDEYGLDGVETGRYESAAGKSFTTTAWRLKDPTGSQAAFRWLRPAERKRAIRTPSITPRALLSPRGPPP